MDVSIENKQIYTHLQRGFFFFFAFFFPSPFKYEKAQLFVSFASSSPGGLFGYGSRWWCSRCHSDIYLPLLDLLPCICWHFVDFLPSLQVKHDISQLFLHLCNLPVFLITGVLQLLLLFFQLGLQLDLISSQVLVHFLLFFQFCAQFQNSVVQLRTPRRTAWKETSYKQHWYTQFRILRAEGLFGFQLQISNTSWFLDSSASDPGQFINGGFNQCVILFQYYKMVNISCIVYVQQKGSKQLTYMKLKFWTCSENFH